MDTMNQMNQLKQILKSPQPLETLKKSIGNNNVALTTLFQIEMMTPEQRAQSIANMCNEKGITLNQLKQMKMFLHL